MAGWIKGNLLKWDSGMDELDFRDLAQKFSGEAFSGKGQMVNFNEVVTCTVVDANSSDVVGQK